MKKEIKNNDRLVAHLLDIIEKRRNGLLKTANAGLMILFWKIGNAFNKHHAAASHIRTLSTQLVANYGAYLSAKNIKMMQQFADQFPDLSYTIQMASFINWECITLLLPLKNINEQLFYLSLVAEKRLTEKELRKQLSANLFDQQKKIKPQKENANKVASINKAFSQIAKLRHKYEALNKQQTINLFKEPSLPAFQLLTEPAILIKKNNNKPGREDELFSLVSQQIEAYRNQQNYFFNMQLNLHFWEIGKRMNEEIANNKNNKSDHRKAIINNAATQLQKKYPKVFNEKQLNAMADFALQFPDRHITLSIARLVSWQHILVLLTLQQTEEKLFYARLTATKELSAAALRKQIAKHVYEQTSGAKEREQAVMAGLQNPVKKTSVKKTGNNIVTIKTIYLNYGDTDNHVVPNIFENTYFSLLLL